MKHLRGYPINESYVRREVAVPMVGRVLVGRVTKEVPLRDSPSLYEISFHSVIQPDGSVVLTATTANHTSSRTIFDLFQWIKGKVKKDPEFVRTEAFRRFASPELKEEYPEAGADFGFFDTVKTNESTMNGFFEVGDWLVVTHGREQSNFSIAPGRWKVVIGWVTDIDPTVFRFQLDSVIMVDNVLFRTTRPIINAYPTDPTHSAKISTGGREVVSYEILEDYIRRRINENPEFIKSEIFRRYAPRELKAKYPEAGADFGFFDAMKESGPRHNSFEIRDPVLVAWGKYRGSVGTVSYVGKTTCTLSFTDVFINGKTATVGEMWNSDADNDFLPMQLILVDDAYLRNRVGENLSFVTSAAFRRFASPGLKREFPELGSDFGFFDTQRTNEGKGSLRHLNKAERGHQKVLVTLRKMADRGKVFEDSYTPKGSPTVFRTHATLGARREETPEVRFCPGGRNCTLHGSGWSAYITPARTVYTQKVGQAWPVDDPRSYTDLLEVFARDPMVRTSPEFRHFPREIRDRYPEAGADFGFFDVERTNETKSKHNFEVGDRVAFYFQNDEYGMVPGEMRAGTVTNVYPKNDTLLVQVDGCYTGDKPMTVGILLSETEHLEPYIRRKISEDPAFVTIPFFRKYAPRELKDKYPEAGADFGFFDTRRTNESIENVSTMRKGAGNTYWELPDYRPHRTDGPAYEGADGSRHWYVYGLRHRTDGPAVEYANGTRSWWVDGKLMSQKEFEKRFPDAYKKWWETQVGKPWFKEAPREVKDKYPEAGADFGFFDARRVDESSRNGRITKGDWVVVTGVKLRETQHYHGKLPYVGRVWLVKGKYYWLSIEGINPEQCSYNRWGDVVKTTAEHLERVDDYIRRQVGEDPVFLRSVFFQKHASPALKREYPEAGADFGFFDATGTNEGKTHSIKRGDWVIDRVSSFHCRVVEISGKVLHVLYSDGAEGWLTPARFIKIDDEYIRGRIDTDPGFVTSRIFRDCASPELKTKYPEAGADFGFFDVRKVESYDSFSAQRRASTNK